MSQRVRRPLLCERQSSTARARSTPDDRPHSVRALSLAKRLALVGFLASLAGCPTAEEPQAAGATGAAPAAPGATGATQAAPAASAELESIVTVLTPPPDDVTSDVTDRWIRDRRELLDRLRRDATRELGRSALVAARARRELPVVVRSDLLSIAAWGAPEESVKPLTEVFEEYEEDLGVRANAALALADADPIAACALLEPRLTDTRPTKTYPPPERILEAWLAATEKLGQDPSALLAHVATDIHRDEALRHRAVRELGRFPGPVGRAALETVLVESTGNFYLRRLAAQSLRASLARDEACALLEYVASREADPGFLNFLGDMIDEHCR